MSEKQSPLWLKMMSILVAVSLGGGYVAWRNHQAEQRRMLPPEAKESETPVMMVGSKSPGRDVLTIDTKQGGPPEGEVTPTQKALMSSSKSMVLSEFVELDDLDVKFNLKTPEEVQAPRAPAPRTILPSSKSISPLLERRGQDTPQQGER